MTARMTGNTATLYPKATEAMMALGTGTADYGIDDATLELTHLRVSQINGCAWCLEAALGKARKAGITDSQLIQLAGWREAKVYSDAQRAALDLAEHMTRIGDRSDPVPDPVWDAAAALFDEQQLGGLVIWIATVNLYNRINVTLRREPGTW